MKSQAQSQPDPQALRKLLTSWVTVSGRKLGSAGLMTLEWLVEEAGFRRTWVTLARNPFGIDSRSMMERLERLAADQTIRIYKTQRGYQGGVELKVRDLWAIAAYREQARDPEKWVLQFVDEAEDEPQATIPFIEEARVSAQKPSLPTLFDAIDEPPPAEEAGVSARKPSLPPGRIKWPAGVVEALGDKRFDVWLGRAQLAVDGQSATIHFGDEQFCRTAKLIAGKHIGPAVSAACNVTSVAYVFDPALAELAPPPPEKEAGVSARKPPLPQPQEVRGVSLIETLSHFPLKEERKKGGIRKLADEIHTAFFDTKLFPWVSLLTAMEVADGLLPHDTLIAWLSDERFGLAKAIKAHMGQRYGSLRGTKNRCHGAGITFDSTWCHNFEKFRRRPEFRESSCRAPP